jgi:hypothetical protein
MAKDLEQRFDSAMKKGKKQDKAKHAGEQLGDMQRMKFTSPNIKLADIERGKRAEARYSKKQGTSTGYMVKAKAEGFKEKREKRISLDERSGIVHKQKD